MSGIQGAAVGLPGGVICTPEWVTGSPCVSSRGWSLKTVMDPALLPETALVNTYCPGIIFNSASFDLQSAPYWIISHMTTLVNPLPSGKSGCVYWSFCLKSLFGLLLFFSLKYKGTSSNETKDGGGKGLEV